MDGWLREREKKKSRSESGNDGLMRYNAIDDEGECSWG